jgi:hypothetical protein
MTSEGSLDILQDAGKTGRKCMEFKIKVDHKVDGGGEEGNYPVGWPRIRSEFAKTEDFSKFDGFALWIKVNSNRDDAGDDFTFLSMNGKSVSNSQVFKEQLLGSVPENSWIPVIIPFQKIFSDNKRDNIKAGCFNKLKEMKSMQIYIGESLYSHGDELVFNIDGPYLYKFKKPFIEKISYPGKMILSETKVLPVKIDFMGCEKGKKLTVDLILENGKNEELATLRKSADKSVLFFVPVSDLTPGKYNFKIKLNSSIVSGPYDFDIIRALK